MRTIAVLNQKGGVGKTTTVTNTAAALAELGARVVVIDLDPQAHLTIHLGLEPKAVNTGSYKVLTQSARFEAEIMLVRRNLWLLPANINLVGAESELVSVVGREIILREAIQSSQETFDFCLIDCAPSLGLLTLNALAAAQEVLIPLQPHFLALQGFGKLLQTIDLVNKRINPDLKVNGILLCMFDSRASLPNEVKSDIEQFLRNARGTNSAWSGACMLPTFIRRNIKLAEAPSYGKTIFEYEQNCNGAEDYRKVGEYIYSQSFELPKPESTQPEPAGTEIEQPEQSVQQDSEFQSESQVENVSNPEPVTEPVPSGEDITQTDNQFQESQEFPPQENQQENQVPEYAEPGGRENQPEDQTQQYQESPSGENRENPPIEIREIPPSTGSQPWREFVQAPTEPHESEADTSEHKQTGQ
jgi:chromosome partitioning protein